jgi:hypothetical protein
MTTTHFVENAKSYIASRVWRLSIGLLRKRSINYSKCPDFFFPPPTLNLKKLFSGTIEGLNRIYQIDSGVERRKVKCLDLITLPGFKPQLFSLGSIDEDFMNHSFPTGTLAVYNGQTEDYVTIFNSLDNCQKLPIVFNKTGTTQPIHLQLAITPNISLTALRLQLQKYGLDLIHKEKVIKILVINVGH